MKKIIALSLLPAFLSASFADSFTNGLGSKLGNGLADSKWCHYSIELIVPLGTMSKLKSDDCEKVKETEKKIATKVTEGAKFFETRMKEEKNNQYILKTNPLLKMGSGLRLYLGLGSKDFQLGYDLGVSCLFNGSSVFDSGFNVYYRYFGFFYRLSGGMQITALRCEETALKFATVGWYGRFQVGYYFYECFYASFAVSYSKFANQKNENGENFLPKDEFNLSTNNEINGQSVSVFISFGMTSNPYEDNLKSAEETATTQELAKLRARDRYKEEKKKELEQKRAEEKNKLRAEEEDRLKARKNKARV